MSEKKQGFAYGSILTMLIIALITGAGTNIFANGKATTENRADIDNLTLNVNRMVENSYEQNAISAIAFQQVAETTSELKTSNALMKAEVSHLTDECDRRFNTCTKDHRVR